MKKQLSKTLSKLLFKSNRLKVSLIATGMFMIPSTGFSEVHPGKEFHDSADCMKCHSAQPYNPQKTDSWPKLVKAVAFCNNNLNTGMFDDEVEQLADYLNQTYYHHSK